jgi:eukaryotic-like serine/threonine-protein kinase
MGDLRKRLERSISDRYRIERELGSGGMAVVYLAWDRKHRRRVAIKVLKPELVPAAGADRFRREIEIAARLTHPNILPLHESGEAGLAIGTLAYMSPEQAAGKKSIDGRSDLYSLGCVLYEMLAGETPLGPAADPTSTVGLSAELRTARQTVSLPMAGVVARALARNPADRFTTAAQLTEALAQATGPATAGSAVVTAPPQAVPWSSSTIRRAIGGAAALCLLAAGVWWWRGRTDAHSIRSIAVLPLESASGDTTYDYLEDGVPDYVRDALNTVPGLTVKARSSSRQLRGRSPRAIGAALGVDAVLQGTVSRSGERLHVTTELVRTANDDALWSRTFDGAASQLAGMQDTIATEVARTLRLSLAAGLGAGRASALRGTKDVDAYDSFLRGRSVFDRLQFPQAAIFFRDAVARDPRFARAEGYLAMSYANVAVLDIGSLDSVLALARATAARALALDSTAVEAYIALAYVSLSEMRIGDALVPLARAMAIDSSDAILLASFGGVLVQAGRLSEGLVQARRAYERDPLSAPAIGMLGYALGVAGRSEEAMAKARLVLQLDPRSVLAYRGLGFQFAFAGMPDSAIAAFEAGIRIDSTTFGGRTGLLFAYAAAGRWSDVERERALIDRERTGTRNYNQMVEHLVDGEYEAAMTSLERGVAAREQYLGVISIACDPLLDPLKPNPRFDALMQRIGAQGCPARFAWPIGRRPGRRGRAPS